MTKWPGFNILDISQPVGRQTACFPGDTPFMAETQVSYAESEVMNLTRFTMSPHVGTHADAPVHVQGDLARDLTQSVGNLPLAPYIGPCRVVDCSPFPPIPIETHHVQGLLEEGESLPPRVLFKTTASLDPRIFEEAYASFSPGLVDWLADHGVELIGIDTPSVDPIDSKTLEAHHRLVSHGMSWLENLDLTQVSSGDYFLVALPLKFLEVEASPIRAVLLTLAGET